MPPEQTPPSALPDQPPQPRRRLSTRQRLLFFLTAWLIVLMPFLFWWNTWFGRNLSDKQLTEYLHDDKKPRHIQHALVQVGERMAKSDPKVKDWYPDLVRLSSHPEEEVRNTDAWLMGQDTSGAGFHQALLKMLNDPSPMVRGNAALSLVRFGDASGRAQIVGLLLPVNIVAPQIGLVAKTSSVGTAVHQNGVIARLESNGEMIEVRSPISGRVSALAAGMGQSVKVGAPLATVSPATDQVWEALRALYLVGQAEDLPAVSRYQRDLPEIPEHIRKQALETEQAIRQRAR
ncbi:MAG: hypothetical protein JST79_02180 [Acidobacteria bacterium]|nr:hypothetical protein [Acidobacteriota bacterium]